MGGVISDSNVTVNTDIEKTVTVDLDKSATVSLDLDGSFADAEAAADATVGDGGTGGGSSGGLVQAFLIDDFLSDQEVIANGPAGMDSSSVDLLAVESDFADGTTRDVTAVNDGDTPEDGEGEFDSGDTAAGLGRFSTGSGVTTEFTLTYDPVDPADLLAGGQEAGAELRFENVGSDNGEMIQITITDEDGTSATHGVEIPEDSNTPFPPTLDLDIPLSEFQSLASGGDGDLDFSNVDSFELVIDGEQDNDSTIDSIQIRTPEEDERNVLAETFTAAQVSPGLATSYSQAVAALEPGLDSDTGEMDMMGA